MGRYYGSRKATAEESCRLEMPYLKKRGLLHGQSAGEITWTSNLTRKKASIDVVVCITHDPHISLIYSVTNREGKKTDYDYEVSLTTTPCNFGGVRYWFDCPSCGMRVGVLYLTPGDVYFRCRHCNDLSYQSRNFSRIELWGHTSRQIESLQKQIKRWTWAGRPTRKVRRLHALECKMLMLSGSIEAQINKFQARLR